MTDNLNFGRIGQNLAIAAVNSVDTALSRIDARFSAAVTVDVGGDNEHTLAQEDIQNVGFIIISGTGSPQPSGDVTITITPTDQDVSPAVAVNSGLYGVQNDTAQDVTFTITGQTKTAPVVPANSCSIILVTSTDVCGVALRAADVTFDDTDGSSPNFTNLQDLGAYLLANVGSGGGGGGAVSVEDGGSEIVAEATTLNFDGGQFTITDNGSGEAGIAITSGGLSAGDISYVDNISGSPTLDNVKEALDYVVPLARSGGGGGGGGLSWQVLADYDWDSGSPTPAAITVPSGAQELIVMAREVRMAAGKQLGVRVSDDGGSTYQTSYSRTYLDNAGSGIDSQSSIQINGYTAVATDLVLMTTIRGVQLSEPKMADGTFINSAGTVRKMVFGITVGAIDTVLLWEELGGVALVSGDVSTGRVTVVALTS